MSSACGEPPDSGVNVSAGAPGTASSSASRAAPRARRSIRRVRREAKAGRIISPLPTGAPLRGACTKPNLARVASAGLAGLAALDAGLQLVHPQAPDREGL